MAEQKQLHVHYLQQFQFSFSVIPCKFHLQQQLWFILIFCWFLISGNIYITHFQLEKNKDWKYWQIYTLAQHSSSTHENGKNKLVDLRQVIVWTRLWSPASTTKWQEVGTLTKLLTYGKRQEATHRQAMSKVTGNNWWSFTRLSERGGPRISPGKREIKDIVKLI